MEMSVREARAQFATALSAAAKGETVTITKNGKAVAELRPPSLKAEKFDWDKLDSARKELGLDEIKLEEGWQERFDDPAFSREVLGLEEDGQPGRP